MGFAAKWTTFQEEVQALKGNGALGEKILSSPSLPAWDPSLNIRTFAQLPNPGHSANTANYATRGSSQTSPLIPTGPDPKGTGLEWLPNPPDSDGPAFDTWWAAFDLADLCKRYGVRVVRAETHIVAVYPPTLKSELVPYTSELLDDARPCLATNIDKLPILDPSEAMRVIKDIMRQHQELRFCRGEDGSRWPLYPTTWTNEQCMAVQSIWFVAGNALDHDNFILVEEK